MMAKLKVDKVRGFLANEKLSNKQKVALLIEESSVTNRARRTLQFWVSGKNRTVALSHVVWNLYHPEDKVRPDEVVHHKDFDSLGDRISNYEKMSKEAHDAIHRPLVIEAMRQANLGSHHTEETRRKISEANRDRVPTLEARKNMSEAHIGNTASDETKAKMSATQRERRSKNMKWNPEEALRLKDLGITKRSIARSFGITTFSMYDYFKRREIAW